MSVLCIAPGRLMLASSSWLWTRSEAAVVRRRRREASLSHGRRPLLTRGARFTGHVIGPWVLVSSRSRTRIFFIVALPPPSTTSTNLLQLHVRCGLHRALLHWTSYLTPEHLFSGRCCRSRRGVSEGKRVVDLRLDLPKNCPKPGSPSTRRTSHEYVDLHYIYV